MKVLHSISGMNIESGGPSLSTYVLVMGLREIGLNSEIVAFSSIHGDGRSISHDLFIHYLPSPKYRRFGFSREFNAFFSNNPNIDLFHAHGLWQYSTHTTAAWACRHKKPCVMSPRGMLYPEALLKSSLFKKVALFLYQKKDLQQASCIHATCEQEYKYIRECGITKPPIAIIPNAIDISGSYPKSLSQYGKKRIGFIGRFAPIKNLEVLLEAWARSEADKLGWELVMVGDGAPKYRNFLENMAFQNLSLKRVIFSGFLSGQAKEDMLQSLDCLVLPSKSR